MPRRLKISWTILLLALAGCADLVGITEVEPLPRDQGRSAGGAAGASSGGNAGYGGMMPGGMSGSSGYSGGGAGSAGTSGGAVGGGGDGSSGQGSGGGGATDGPCAQEGGRRCELGTEWTCAGGLWGSPAVCGVGCDSAMERCLTIRSVALSCYAGCMVLSDGKVRCWGSRDNGILGDGEVPSDDLYREPVEVVGLPKIQSVSMGCRHACALSEQGEVFCWGANSFGELGDGSGLSWRLAPAPTPILSGISRLAVAPWRSSCAVRADDGAVLCWGKEYSADFGDINPVNVPTPVPGLAGISSLAASSQVACAYGEKISCWGWSVATGTNQGGPSPAMFPSAMKPEFLGESDSAVYAFSEDGARVFAWGADDNLGLLGAGKPMGKGFSFVETTNTVLADGARVRWVRGGWRHACALVEIDDTKHVRCWGANSSGEIGQGGVSLRVLAPVDMVLDGKPLEAEALAVGFSHNCAVLPGRRSLACWGAGFNGQFRNNESLLVPTILTFPP